MVDLRPSTGKSILASHPFVCRSSRDMGEVDCSDSGRLRKSSVEDNVNQISG